MKRLLKRLALSYVLLLLCICSVSPKAEASALDWPVVSQLSNVVRCVIADAGTITRSLVTHATAFTVETLQTVGECLLYNVQQITPGIISNPHFG